MRSVLSSFRREKSGARSPGARWPARARSQKVSKGRMRKTASGMWDMTRPKVSGDCRIDHQINPAKAK